MESILRGILITATLFQAHPALAQFAFDYRNYPPIRHDVPLHSQDTMVWCWVAVAQMIANYYGQNAPSQCEMLQEQYRAPCCSNPQACMRGGHIQEIRALIRKFGGRPSGVAPPANGFVLYDALRRGPIVLHTTQGAGHFVVATGMRVVPSPIGPLGIVSINDPYYGVYEVEFPKLASIWTAAVLMN